MTTDTEVAEEDRLRADWYGLLARLLGKEPEESFLRSLAELEGDDSEMGQAVATLGKTAAQLTSEDVKHEYFALFVGAGGSELLPYASYYKTGFMNDRPLARLRSDMLTLGIAREEGVSEPEDHIASLCEMMSALIAGDFGDPLSLEEQNAFFEKHFSGWAQRFFEDLEAAPSAHFYMPVGTIGKIFLSIETQAFEMAA